MAGPSAALWAQLVAISLLDQGGGRPELPHHDGVDQVLLQPVSSGILV